MKLEDIETLITLGRAFPEIEKEIGRIAYSSMDEPGLKEPIVSFTAESVPETINTTFELIEGQKHLVSVTLTWEVSERVTPKLGAVRRDADLRKVKPVLVTPDTVVEEEAEIGLDLESLSN